MSDALAGKWESIYRARAGDAAELAPYLIRLMLNEFETTSKDHGASAILNACAVTGSQGLFAQAISTVSRELEGRALGVIAQELLIQDFADLRKG